MDALSFAMGLGSGLISGLGLCGSVIYLTELKRKNNPQVKAKIEEENTVGNVFEICGNDYKVFVDGELLKEGQFKSYGYGYSDPYDLVRNFLIDKYHLWISDYSSKYKSNLILRKPFSVRFKAEGDLIIRVQVKYIE